MITTLHLSSLLICILLQLHALLGYRNEINIIINVMLYVMLPVSFKLWQVQMWKCTYRCRRFCVLISGYTQIFWAPTQNKMLWNLFSLLSFSLARSNIKTFRWQFVILTGSYIAGSRSCQLSLVNVNSLSNLMKDQSWILLLLGLCLLPASGVCGLQKKH